jgi:hypothetical protein
LYLPVAHEWHVAPVLAWNLPTLQSVQAAEPMPACWPVTQLSQLAALYVAVYLPASHPLQPAVPASR